MIQRPLCQIIYMGLGTVPSPTHLHAISYCQFVMEAKHATQDHKIRVQVSPLQFMYNFTHKAKSNHLYILGNAKQIIAARARER